MTPARNRAQQKYFDYLERQGKMPKKPALDLSEEPEAYADGGMVPEDNFDYEEGHAEEYDSSGEPYTEDELEDRHPMELMNRGGRVKRMSSDGRVPSSDFVKALSRSY